jgi:hypothetical protein
MRTCRLGRSPRMIGQWESGCSSAPPAVVAVQHIPHGTTQELAGLAGDGKCPGLLERCGPQNVRPAMMKSDNSHPFQASKRGGCIVARGVTRAAPTPHPPGSGGMPAIARTCGSPTAIASVFAKGAQTRASILRRSGIDVRLHALVDVHSQGPSTCLSTRATSARSR